MVDDMACTPPCRTGRTPGGSQGLERLRDTGVLGEVRVFSVDLYRSLPEGLKHEIGNFQA